MSVTSIRHFNYWLALHLITEDKKPGKMQKTKQLVIETFGAWNGRTDCKLI